MGSAARSCHTGEARNALRIGSISKQFTAAAILLLQEQGKFHSTTGRQIYSQHYGARTK